MDYNIYGLKQYNEEYLLKTSIISLINTISSLDSNHIDSYTMTIIPLLIDILASDIVKQETKLSCFSCLGDIILYCPSAFKHLDDIMSITLSACETALQSSSDIDIMEYLQQLKQTLLQVLSSIAISTGENNKRKELAQYIPQIFANIKLFNLNAEGNELKHSSIVLIGDLVVLYQHNLKPLLQDIFFTNLINTLKLGHIKKYNKTIEWVENLIKNII
jgi:hypothetical protein